MIRVLIVDDSEVYRLFLREALSQEKDIEIVSMASNGRLALPRVNHYKPDIVLLDYDMPEMDGLETIPEIKKLSPHSRVIMFSSHTLRGAKLTLQALELGADDFISKPASVTLNGNAEILRQQILERIRGFATPASLPRHDLPAAKRTQGRKNYRNCLIGISTGGPPALRRLFSRIPGDIQGSIFVVQHMPPLFTAHLAESLNAESELEIFEAQDGQVPAPATVYIAPGGKQMRISGSSQAERRIVVEESNPDELCKPSANILFNSFAELCAEDTLAVIMTGMGEDGYQGMKNLALHGAHLMAQGAEDCVIFGMPAKPIRDGIVSEIDTVEGLAERITEYLK